MSLSSLKPHPNNNSLLLPARRPAGDHNFDLKFQVVCGRWDAAAVKGCLQRLVGKCPGCLGNVRLVSAPKDLHLEPTLHLMVSNNVARVITFIESSSTFHQTFFDTQGHTLPRGVAGDLFLCLL